MRVVGSPLAMEELGTQRCAVRSACCVAVDGRVQKGL